MTLDDQIKDALHGIIAKAFDKIEEKTDIQVEDLTIDTFAVSVSVTIKPKEEET